MWYLDPFKSPTKTALLTTAMLLPPYFSPDTGDIAIFNKCSADLGYNLEVDDLDDNLENNVLADFLEEDDIEDYLEMLLTPGPWTHTTAQDITGHLLTSVATLVIEHEASGLDVFSPEPVSRKVDGFFEAGKTTMKWPDVSIRIKSNSMKSVEDQYKNSRMIYEVL